MSKNIPATAGAAGLIPYLSARKRHEAMDTWFVLSGGMERLVHVTDKSDENYLEVLKIWAKGLPRVASVEHNPGAGMEALLDRLDKGESAEVINGEYTEVKDAPA